MAWSDAARAAALEARRARAKGTPEQRKTLANIERQYRKLASVERAQARNNPGVASALRLAINYSSPAGDLRAKSRELRKVSGIGESLRTKIFKRRIKWKGS